MTLPGMLKSGEVARLLPVVSDSSKESRAASILMATLSSVKPYCESMLGSLGLRVGKRANLVGYAEVVFNKGLDVKSRPDGFLVLDTGGGKTWTALVEAKIGKADLEPEQIERYLALAKANGIDAVHSLPLPRQDIKGCSKRGCCSLSLVLGVRMDTGKAAYD